MPQMRQTQVQYIKAASYAIAIFQQGTKINYLLRQQTEIKRLLKPFLSSGNSTKLAKILSYSLQGIRSGYRRLGVLPLNSLARQHILQFTQKVTTLLLIVGQQYQRVTSYFVFSQPRCAVSILKYILLIKCVRRLSKEIGIKSLLSFTSSLSFIS